MPFCAVERLCHVITATSTTTTQAFSRGGPTMTLTALAAKRGHTLQSLLEALAHMAASEQEFGATKAQALDSALHVLPPEVRVEARPLILEALAQEKGKATGAVLGHDYIYD